MTEFVTRNYSQKEFEVIIKTDNKDYYKATEDFARKLIDHAKPQTNADRIRAMSDRELADFLSGKGIDVHGAGYNLSANQREAIKHNLFCAFMKWLRMPVDEVSDERR